MKIEEIKTDRFEALRESLADAQLRGHHADMATSDLISEAQCLSRYCQDGMKPDPKHTAQILYELASRLESLRGVAVLSAVQVYNELRGSKHNPKRFELRLAAYLRRELGR